MNVDLLEMTISIGRTYETNQLFLDIGLFFLTQETQVSRNVGVT